MFIDQSNKTGDKLICNGRIPYFVKVDIIVKDFNKQLYVCGRR
jgi:hypothetical protein